MLEVPKPYFGDCTEFLSDEEYFLKQRAKEIADDNYLGELSRMFYNKELSITGE